MIEFGHISHVGLRRELNEDTYYGDSELGLWLVADGMGGHEYGEVASALARETIVREVRSGKALAQAIRIADEEIIRVSRRRNDSLPMGTTVVAVRVDGPRFEVAWVGDSRVYLWRDRQLAQLSQDHSYVQALIEQVIPRENEFLRLIEDTGLGIDGHEDENVVDEDALEAEISKSALVNLVEGCLVEAVRQGASDIHIVAKEGNRTEFWFRTDGNLKLWHAQENTCRKRWRPWSRTAQRTSTASSVRCRRTASSNGSSTIT